MERSAPVLTPRSVRLLERVHNSRSHKDNSHGFVQHRSLREEKICCHSASKTIQVSTGSVESEMGEWGRDKQGDFFSGFTLSKFLWSTRQNAHPLYKERGVNNDGTRSPTFGNVWKHAGGFLKFIFSLTGKIFCESQSRYSTMKPSGLFDAGSRLKLAISMLLWKRDEIV